MYSGIRPGVGVLTVKEIILRAQREFGPRVFARRRRPSGDFDVASYNDLYETISRLGAALATLGVKKGTRVAVTGENRVEWAAFYLAVLAGGAVAVPLDPALKDKERSEIMERAGVEVALASPAHAAALAAFKQKVASLRDVISMEGSGGGWRGWEETLARGDDDGAKRAFWEREVALDDLAVLLFTSGTTGASKAVMLTHRNLGANVNQTYQALPYDHADVFLSLLPLHHTFEATAGMLIPAFAGSSITYARSFKSKEIIEDIRDTGVTMMLGVPLVYEKMLAGINRAVADAPFFKRAFVNAMRTATRAVYFFTGANVGFALFAGLRKKAGLDTIRMFISGAAPLKAEVSGAFYFLGLPLLQGYGLTETSPVVSVNLLWRIKFSSSGPPIPGCQVRIHEPDSQGIGEVTIKGDNVMVGYYEDPALTASVLRDDWFFTGDAGWLDRDGYLYITGRIKNVIVTAAGKNIHPEEVEAELDASPVIAEAAVMAMQDPSTAREVVGAVVFPDYEYLEEEAKRRGDVYDGSFVDREVRDAVNNACAVLADYKRVKIIKIRNDALPKTTTMKVKRYLFKNGEQIRES